MIDSLEVQVLTAAICLEVILPAVPHSHSRLLVGIDLSVANEQGTSGHVPPAKRFARSMSAAYLEKLNADQRRAVEYGVRKSATDTDHALLVIAGAARIRFRRLPRWAASQGAVRAAISAVAQRPSGLLSHA